MTGSLGNDCIGSVSRHLFGTSYEEMRSSQKLLFAIGIICALGALLCFFLSLSVNGSYPAEAEIYLCGGVISGGASIFLFYRLIRGAAPRSSYHVGGMRISVLVEKRALKESPLEHMHDLSTHVLSFVTRGLSPSLYVTFSGQPGIDDGGLSKDYLDDLFEGLVQCPELSFTRIESSALAVPSVTTDDVEKLVHYRGMGQIMTWCQNEKLPIGQHFDPSVFSVAFSLSAEEIETPFGTYPFERKLELYRILLAGQHDEGHHQLFDLLETEKWNREQVELAATLALFTSTLPEDLKSDSETANLAKILDSPDHITGVRTALIQMACDFFDPQLRGIHAIALGMKDVSNWDETYYQADAHAFSVRLQGSLDKEYIAHSIVYAGYNPVVMQKIGWLKQWLLEAASERDIQQVVKFITGSTCLPEGKEITVLEQPAAKCMSFPKANTCSNQIHLAPIPAGKEDGDNDFTKENFIACLLHAAYGQENDYSME